MGIHMVSHKLILSKDGICNWRNENNTFESFLFLDVVLVMLKS